MDWHPECLWKRKARLEAVILFILFVIKVTPVEADLQLLRQGLGGRVAVKLSWGLFPSTWPGSEGGFMINSAMF